jgi:hypothetical protein
MVASVGDLNLDVGQVGFVEQMASELAACTGKIRPIDAVRLKHAPDPPCWTEREREH